MTSKKKTSLAKGIKLDTESRAAGLLWYLLPPSFRRKVSRELSLTEIEKLNQSYTDYRKSSRPSRIRTEQFLRNNMSPRFPAFLFIYGFGLLIITILLLIVHSLLNYNYNINTRIILFTPLFLGIMAPVLMAALPAYRIRMLFRFTIDPAQLPMLFLAFMGTVWMIAFIRISEKPAFYTPLDSFSLGVLFLGAISAPLLEETFFRELLPGMFGRSPYWIGHLLSAILFSAGHLPSGWEMAFYYILSGLFLSMARIFSGRLIYPVMIHSAANGIMVFM
jgi:membrane protease YdiL (CAAX protease family)